jgi:hypothetical protein
MLEHRRKENDEKQKSKIVERGSSKGKTENTNTQKKWGKKPQNFPITVATTTDAWDNYPLLPDLQ